MLVDSMSNWLGESGMSLGEAYSRFKFKRANTRRFFNCSPPKISVPVSKEILTLRTLMRFSM